MAKLFRSAPPISSKINAVVDTGLQSFDEDVSRILDMGAKIYKAAARKGYQIALNVFLAKTYIRMKRGNYRSLTQAYTLAKSKKGSAVKALPWGATAKNARAKKTHYGANDHFQGFRHRRENNIQTRAKGYNRGASLLSFMQGSYKTGKASRSLIRFFGDIEREVYGSVFKEGTTATKNYLRDSQGVRAKTVDQVIYETIRTRNNVVRLGKQYKDLKTGKRYGVRRASELGLVGSKVSFSMAGRLLAQMKRNQGTVIDLFKLPGGQYGGMFAGSKGLGQALKLQDMATGNKRKGVKRAAIDPFGEEALAMLGLGATKGYLNEYVLKEILKAAKKANNVKVQTVLGEIGVKM